MSYKVNGFITTDKEFPSYEKRLSICLTPNGFSFSLTTIKDQLITFGEALHSGTTDMASLSNDIKEVFKQLSIQSFGFASIELVVPSDLSTWIPDSLYEDDLKSSYLRLLAPSVQVGHLVFADHSSSIGAYQIFTADGTVATAFKIALPGIVVRSQHSKLAETDVVGLGVPCMLAYIRDGKVDIAVFNAGRFVLSNTFCATSDKDILSVTLDVMHQLQIETPSTTLFLCGNVGRDTYMSLRNYFPQVKLYTGRRYSFVNPEFQHLHSYQHVLTLI